MKATIRILCFLLTGFFFSCSNSHQPQKDTPDQGNPGSPPPQKATTGKSENNHTGMVYFPRGVYRIGSESGLPNEKPVHEVELRAFYMDQSPVTVKQFREFIEATGFQTEAEKFGDAGVFNFKTNQWELKKGATWNFPFGPGGEKATDDHPVTQVSWKDAVAFASWAGKRLPSEAEWEVAARGGTYSDQRFSWGNELIVNGKYQANVWQGENTGNYKVEDGFLYTSPVGAFGANKAGLTDMGGNVWNWCRDTYAPYPGNMLPFQPDDHLKVIRGGSFFFDENGEKSVTVSGRSFNSLETSLFNTGFRCAGDAD